MHRYVAFGLHIAADIEMRELLLDDSANKIDVCIKAGNLSESSTISSPQRLFLSILEIGSFLIENGHSITYSLPEKMDLDDLRLFLLGSCMGAILQQRGYIVLHGNAISIDSKLATIFLGKRGAGKSTTAAWYYQQGAYVLADDVCAITFRDNQPYVIPTYPQIKLWQQSADLLSINTQHLRRVQPAFEKFSISLKNQFMQTPLPIAKLIEINQNEPPIPIVKGLDKFYLLLRHRYRHLFLKDMGIEHIHTKLILQLAESIAIHKMQRIVLEKEFS